MQYLLSEKEEGTVIEKAVLDQGAQRPAVSMVSSYEHDGVSDLERQEAALAAYEQAIQLVPREAVLHYHKGQVLEQLGRVAEAGRAYEEARRLSSSKMEPQKSAH